MSTSTANAASDKKPTGARTSSKPKTTEAPAPPPPATFSNGGTTAPPATPPASNGQAKDTTTEAPLSLFPKLDGGICSLCRDEGRRVEMLAGDALVSIPGTPELPGFAPELRPTMLVCRGHVLTAYTVSVNYWRTMDVDAKAWLDKIMPPMEDIEQWEADFKSSHKSHESHEETRSDPGAFKEYEGGEGHGSEPHSEPDNGDQGDDKGQADPDDDDKGQADPDDDDKAATAAREGIQKELLNKVGEGATPPAPPAPPKSETVEDMPDKFTTLGSKAFKEWQIAEGMTPKSGRTSNDLKIRFDASLNESQRRTYIATRKPMPKV